MIIDDYSTAAHRFTMTACRLTTPEAKTSFVSVPGMSGQVDVSDVPNGICYDNRTLTASFEISCGCMAERRGVLDELIAHVHGRRCQIQHPDHPGWHLIGRVTVEEKTHNLSYSAVDITAICDPWFDYDSLTEAVIPVQVSSLNMAKYSKFTMETSISTATLGMVGESSKLFPHLTTTGIAQQVGVFRLSGLTPSHTYYVSGRLTGVGKWAASPTTTMPGVFTPFVTASASGDIYIAITRLQSTGYVGLDYFICIDADKMQVMHNTDFETTVTSEGRSSLESVIISVNGISYPLILRRSTDFVLPPGDVPVISIRSDSTAGTVNHISWRRKKL